MAYDAHLNLAFSTVVTAPSPRDSGTSLVVQTGDGAKFPAASFNATVWPPNVNPLSTTGEIVRVTNISTDTFTITRAQETTTAKSIDVGWQIAATITAKTITDIEAAIPNGAWTDYSATSTIVGWASFTTKKIFYMQIGKTVFVNFDLRGTSNSTSATFTVAVVAKNNSSDYENSAGINQDNSVVQSTPARIFLDPTTNTTLVNLTRAGGTVGWTASGTKDIRGQFIYEAA